MTESAEVQSFTETSSPTGSEPATRILALAEGSFGAITSKTANACIRYSPEKVVGIIDSTLAGQTAQAVLGFGGDIPVVATLEEGLALGPTALLVEIGRAHV